MESILTSTKKLLGIVEEYEHFDPDIIMHINSTFMVLNQLGIGPKEGFYIEDKAAYWEDYLDDETKLPILRTYMGLKVRLLFDPPSNSTLMKALENSIEECEFRLNVEVDRELKQ